MDDEASVGLAAAAAASYDGLRHCIFIALGNHQEERFAMISKRCH